MPAADSFCLGCWMFGLMIKFGLVKDSVYQTFINSKVEVSAPGNTAYSTTHCPAAVTCLAPTHALPLPSQRVLPHLLSALEPRICCSVPAHRPRTARAPRYETD